MISRSRIIRAVSLTAFIAACFAAAGAPAANAACVPATNIEAILDDSGSMIVTDPDVNRVEAIKLLISKSSNAKKTLGALEFGSANPYDTPPLPGATTLFAPELIGPNIASMGTALTNNVKADHGTTDYNAAFAQAKTDNPNANARIFITDGGHNEGAYTNGHTPGPPTYVLGMGIGAASASDADATRLQQIANDTGGVYFPNVNSGNVQATVNQVDAALNCQAISKTFTDLFSKAGQAKAKSLKVGASTRSIDFTLSWKSPLDKFTITNLKLTTSRGTTISVARKHLKIKKNPGNTYVGFHVSGLKRGKLTFKLKNVALASGSYGGVSLTTQAQQSRRR